MPSNHNKTKLVITKINDKSDLYNAISSNSNVLFITHSYFENVPNKLKLMITTSEIASQLEIKKLMFVNPVELFHYGETIVHFRQRAAQREVL